MASEGALGAPAKVQLVDVHAERHNAIGGLGNLVVWVSYYVPGWSFFERVLAVARNALQAYPAGIAFVVVIDSAARPPESESRQAILRFYGELRGVVRCVAHVVEGEGFGAAAKRGALAIMTMSDRYGFAMRVTGTIDETVPVLNRDLAPDGLVADAAALAAAVAELRARYASAS
jgi:hypothetical protein